MPIELPFLDVQTDENGDRYVICHRDDEDDEGFEIEWRFYPDGRSA